MKQSLFSVNMYVHLCIMVNNAVCSYGETRTFTNLNLSKSLRSSRLVWAIANASWAHSYVITYIGSYHSKKAMEYERFGNCLTNARQKIRYVFGQNFTDIVYMDRRHNLLTAFVPGSV